MFNYLHFYMVHKINLVITVVNYFTTIKYILLFHFINLNIHLHVFIIYIFIIIKYMPCIGHISGGLHLNLLGIVCFCLAIPKLSSLKENSYLLSIQVLSLPVSALFSLP